MNLVEQYFKPAKKPLLLAIIDGFGIDEPSEYNAFYLANAPFLKDALTHYPNSLISTSGLDVGLPEGQMGNSEVGHMSIGSGRIIMQDLPRISLAIKDGSLAANPLLQNIPSNSTVHLMGLVSDGGVHSHIDHIIGLAKILANKNCQVLLHVILDGRDTAPRSAQLYIKQLKEQLAGLNCQITSFGGRYYYMDRDKRVERTALAVDALLGNAPLTNDIEITIEQNYSDAVSDEFIKPYITAGYAGIKDGDYFICANFRADRVRQIMESLVIPGNNIPRFHAISMTNYSDELAQFMPCLFSHEHENNILAEVLSAHNLKQLRIAETEKYAHVTYFFNAGREEPFPGEDRYLAQSPKVATYDLQPSMAAAEIRDKLVEAINSQKYDVLIVNFANCDMVGHSGILPAAIEAVEAVDQALGEVAKTLLAHNGTMLITSDHGNVENMKDLISGQDHTAHTTNPVPLIAINQLLRDSNIHLKSGRLCDIAPTILTILNIKQPNEMTGTSLI